MISKKRLLISLILYAGISLAHNKNIELNTPDVKSLLPKNKKEIKYDIKLDTQLFFFQYKKKEIDYSNLLNTKYNYKPTIIITNLGKLLKKDTLKGIEYKAKIKIKDKEYNLKVTKTRDFYQTEIFNDQNLKNICAMYDKELGTGLVSTIEF